MSKMGRLRSLFVVALVLPPLLFSCSLGQAGDYAYGNLITSAFEKQEYKSYYRVGSFDNLESNGRTINTDYFHIFQSGNTSLNMPITGEVPLLVVPVDFSDSKGNSDDIELINRAFCGNKAANQYVSVAEFYSYSSLDRLHLKPTVVSSFFRSSTYPSVKSLSSISSSSGTTTALTKMYEEASSWLKKSNVDLKAYSFTSVAKKTVLPIYFVYKAPYSGESGGRSNRNSMFWAFTINRPAPIAWSSINMLHATGGRVDAHTFIHETGHLLGLEDYYDTSSSATLSRTSHLGRMDMMDSSLGDHNAFSKMLLGWGRPFVPTDSCEITLHQSSGNNEMVLLSPDWNSTPYDSYLLLEFYTPTGLNYTDAFLRSDESMRLFQKPGIKIYYVDARLDLYNGYYSTGKALDENNYTGGRLYFGHHNSSFTSPLIQLLNKERNSAQPTPYFIASDHEADLPYGSDGNTLHLSDALFYEGEGIDGNHFSDVLIKGNKLGWKVEVKELTNSYATLSFIKTT